jgi:hypothetical protein
MYSGSLFHAVGPETENAWSSFLVRVRGTIKVDASMSADLRPDGVRTEKDKRTMSVRYNGLYCPLLLISLADTVCILF